MSKQTAVEWLKKELEDYGSNSHLSLDWNTFDELCEQAKEMEKQQIMKFAIKAVTSAVNEDANNPYNLEQLFTETYGSKGSDEHIVDTNEMISSQTEISDEEIHKAATNYSSLYYEFRAGAKWYREQLKQRQ